MEYKSCQNVRQKKTGEDLIALGKGYIATMRHAMSDNAFTLPEASLRLPFDNKSFEASRALSVRLSGPKLAYILHIGIGGSNLGAKALYEATAGALDAHSPFAPKILFADTCAPELLADLTEILLSEMTDKEEIIVVIASKSGTTAETIVNASILVGALEKKFGSIADRIVCITDEGSALWKTAEKQKYHVLVTQKMVGGRYSVFSPAGMFPLLCIGVDGEALLRGARTSVGDCVEQGIDSDAFKAAQDIYNWHAQETFVFDLFVFHPELEGVGKWYRQLFAESIGKTFTTEGKRTTHRMVPTVSVGSTDLHSVEQMVVSSPGLVARILLRAHAPHWEHEFLIEDKVFAPLAANIAHRAPCEVMDAIYKGVVESYEKKGIPFSEIVLVDLDPESLGAFLQFMMCTIMHLANLLKINAFDQPDVEEYKEVARHILSGDTK